MGRNSGGGGGPAKPVQPAVAEPTTTDLVELSRSNTAAFTAEVNRREQAAISSPGRMVKMATGWYVTYNASENELITIERMSSLPGSNKWIARARGVVGDYVAGQERWYSDPAPSKRALLRSLGL